MNTNNPNPKINYKNFQNHKNQTILYICEVFVNTDYMCYHIFHWSI